MVTKRVLVNVFFLLLATVVIASCGFSLRGQYNINYKYKTLNIAGKFDEGFKNTLIKSLQDADINVLTNNKNPNFSTLNIREVKYKRSIHSLKMDGTIDRYLLEIFINYAIDEKNYQISNFSFINFDKNNAQKNKELQTQGQVSLNKQSVRFILLKLQTLK
jgi:outer membrane lipopolysaccharide assembly protein LptE/RlpB